MLMLCILGLGEQRNTPAPEELIPAVVAAIVLGISMSMSGNCGGAINPARDLGPRLFTLTAGWGTEVFTWVAAWLQARPWTEKHLHRENTLVLWRCLEGELSGVLVTWACLHESWPAQSSLSHVHMWLLLLPKHCKYYSIMTVLTCFLQWVAERICGDIENNLDNKKVFLHSLLKRHREMVVSVCLGTFHWTPGIHCVGVTTTGSGSLWWHPLWEVWWAPSCTWSSSTGSCLNSTSLRGSPLPQLCPASATK